MFVCVKIYFFFSKKKKEGIGQLAYWIVGCDLIIRIWGFFFCNNKNISLVFPFKLDFSRFWCLTFQVSLDMSCHSSTVNFLVQRPPSSSFSAAVDCKRKVAETSFPGWIVNFNPETYEYSYSFNNPSLISKSHRLFYWNNVSAITNENHTGSFFIQQTD